MELTIEGRGAEQQARAATSEPSDGPMTQVVAQVMTRVTTKGVTRVDVGDRIRIDSAKVRMSLPKDSRGHVTPQGVRLARTFEQIVDATAFTPYVTEVRDEDVEIASSCFGPGMKSLRIPRVAVLAVAIPARETMAKSHGSRKVDQ